MEEAEEGKEDEHRMRDAGSSKEELLAKMNSFLDKVEAELVNEKERFLLHCLRRRTTGAKPGRAAQTRKVCVSVCVCVHNCCVCVQCVCVCVCVCVS